MHRDDYELIKKYVDKGDAKSFEKIYLKYVKDIFRFVYSRTGRKDLTEDIVSDTFILLFDVLKNFDLNSGTNPKNFIIGIALNKIRHHNDKQIRQGVVDLDNEIFDEFIDETDDLVLEQSDKLKNELTQELNKMESPHKDVVIMRFFENKSVAEVAKELSLSEANVRVIQYRALQHLKKNLKL